MLESERPYVALLIDWDNLAISIATDMNGATPDLHRIVQATQRYGTIILARAYAEWTSTSDRLEVYRAGVEPAYAPTFRFEPEQITQAIRGKSLADPCLVADCVDYLHLLPMISVFVLVSGDKDLVPAVRLLQLRGKRVVVIGPDLAANILREMADEFIPYRKLVEVSEKAPSTIESTRSPTVMPFTTITATPKAAGTEHGPKRRPALRAKPTASPTAPSVSLVSRTGRASAAISPATTPTRMTSQAEPAVSAEGDIVIPGEGVAKDEMGEAREGRADLQPVFMAMVEILQQHMRSGRPRLRATNLKDRLMARISGFNERNYGFSKFKDLLLAAEKAGVITINLSSPAHWVSLLPMDQEQPSTEGSTTTLSAETEETTVGEEAKEVLSVEQCLETIRFIHELGHRSRWLTYTYVLANLISHLSQSGPLMVAEAEARALLNHLVQQGALQIDKEPQEVEVAGAKHRVRMCHLQRENPLVLRALETLDVGRTTPALAEEGLATAQVTSPVEEIPLVATEENFQEAPVDLLAITTDTPTEKKISQPPLALAEQQISPLVEMGEGSESSQGQMGEAYRQPFPPERVTSAEAIEEALAQENMVAEAAREADLKQAFESLAGALKEIVGPIRPRVTAPILKNKLCEVMKSFDERQYGFAKFKDFLLAAQEAGYVKVKSVGFITWVTPIDEHR